MGVELNFAQFDEATPFEACCPRLSERATQRIPLNAFLSERATQRMPLNACYQCLTLRGRLDRIKTNKARRETPSLAILFSNRPRTILFA